MNKNKEELFINKLLKLTQEDVIKWSENRYRLYFSGEEKPTGKAYIAEVEGETVRLYPYDIKVYTDVDEFNLEGSFRLEIIGNDGHSKWEFIYDRALIDLYRSVQFKSEGVGSFIDRFLDR